MLDWVSIRDPAARAAAKAPTVRSIRFPSQQSAGS